MEFLEKIFAAIDSTDSIAFLVFIFAFFLLGFLIAALGYGGRARQYRRELDRLKKNYADLQVEHERLQEQIDLKQADLIRAEREAEEATMLVRNIEREKENMNIEIATLTDENNELTELTHTYANNIEALNNQILGLKTRNNQLSTNAEQEGESMNQLMEMQSSYNATVNRLAALETKLETYSGENNTLRQALDNVKSTTGGETSFEDLNLRIEAISQDNTALQAALENVKNNATNSAPLADLESKIQKIMDDNAALHKELEDVKSSREVLPFAAVDMDDGSRSIGDDEAETATAEESVGGGKSKSDLAEAAKIAVKDALGHKIEAAKREDKDDLTIIKGVGNFIEQKLNGLGIFTYRQISQFDKELAEQVTAGIEFFPGRIERDNWVGQATQLLDVKRDDDLKRSIYPENIDDLKIIEGIGPKLEKLLKNAGISNWNDLAKTDVKHLKEILIKGGNKYRIHDPSTWPMQAQMASDWKWTKLKDYQDYLVGGGEEK
jgi:predicted flap endonuclease-1-like 5' DNA nuclease